MPQTVTLGPAIRAIRKAQRVSQLDLAQRAGVSGPYLTNIEGGRRQPSLDTTLRIAHALDVPPEAITYELPSPDAYERVCTCTSTQEAS